MRTAKRKQSVSQFTQPRLKRAVNLNRRANRLNGGVWLKNSLSIWSDVTKTKEEKTLKHPATFPEMLVERLILSFLNRDNAVILDPFLGSGSTLAAAAKQGYRGVGFEIYDEFLMESSNRLARFKSQCALIKDSAANIGKHISAASIDMVITSPPYLID